MVNIDVYVEALYLGMAGVLVGVEVLPCESGWRASGC